MRLGLVPDSWKSGQLQHFIQKCHDTRHTHTHTHYLFLSACLSFSPKSCLIRMRYFLVSIENCQAISVKCLARFIIFLTYYSNSSKFSKIWPILTSSCIADLRINIRELWWFCSIVLSIVSVQKLRYPISTFIIPSATSSYACTCCLAAVWNILYSSV